MGSSNYLREIAKGSWPASLEEFLDQPTKKWALAEFRERLYYRGGLPTELGQTAISWAVLEAEIARGFKTRGMYRKRLGYFVDGLAIGSEEFIRGQMNRMREEGRYTKDNVPELGCFIFRIPHCGHFAFVKP